MMDELEALLKQAKHHAYKEKIKKDTKKLLAKIVIKRQADLEWTVGKTVCLIHKDKDGNETALGIFIEHLRGSSRWLRPTAESLSPDHCEIVTGSWWIHPSIREIPVDSVSEVIAIRQRFEMLMSEFDSEFNIKAENYPLTDLPLEPDDEEWDDEEEDEDLDEDEEEDEE